MTKKKLQEAPILYGGAALQVIANKKLQSRIKVILEEYELNLTQWLIISRLNDIRAGLRTTDLAKFMHVEVPLVTMMSRPLRKRGLITSVVRTPDKREKVLNVTSKAKEIIEVVESRLQKQVAGMTKDVSLQDLQTYFKVLQSMVGSPA
ncbi:MAG TPA: MarR family transcriptional regulator [Candidatus Saccharimonadales bacterium]|jgi:DNA-binding MarR family transcriptional regulator